MRFVHALIDCRGDNMAAIPFVFGNACQIAPSSSLHAVSPAAERKAVKSIPRKVFRSLPSILIVHYIINTKSVKPLHHGCNGLFRMFWIKLPQSTIQIQNSLSNGPLRRAKIRVLRLIPYTICTPVGHQSTKDVENQKP